MIARYTADREDRVGAEWLLVNLGWTLSLCDYDALVVPSGWQCRYADVQHVIKAAWNNMPIYMLTHTSNGFRLDHVHVEDRTLAMLHTAHACGYAVKPS
jgi:hypothetical protein